MKRTICLGVLLTGLVGCSEPSLPSWLNTPTSTDSAAEIVGLVVQPRALNSGDLTQGTVTLRVAGTGPTTVAVSSSDSAVMVPATVTVPAGSISATFPITTSSVAAESTVLVGASVSGTLYQTALVLWPVTANSFWYEITPSGAYGRYSAENATLTASCAGNLLDFRINGSQWRVILSAVHNGPLHVGVYEGAATGVSSSGPALFLDNGGLPPCLRDGIGRFVVHEADLPQRSPVRRFVATFEQSCRNGSATIRGEIRVTNPPPSLLGPVFCIR